MPCLLSQPRPDPFHAGFAAVERAAEALQGVDLIHAEADFLGDFLWVSQCFVAHVSLWLEPQPGRGSER